MSEFKVKTSHIRAAVGEQNEIARQMKQLEDEIWQIQNGLSFEIAQKQQIRQRLKNTRNTVSSQAKGIYNATKALNQIADTYETTEAKLAGNKVSNSNLEPITNLTDVMDLFTGLSSAVEHITNLPDKLSSGLEGALQGLLKIVPVGEIFYQEKEEKWKFGTYSDKLAKEDLKIKDSWYSKNKKELEDSKIDVFKVIDKKWKDTQSLYHLEEVEDKDNIHISETFDLLKQEMKADLYGGLYVTDPDTGKRKLRMAAGVELGYSITALSMEQEIQLGDKYLGVYCKTEEAVGRIDGKAEAVIGLRDAEGKLNPTLHAKVAGEAILAEASAKFGAKVLGADVGLKAGVNFGVGAHAEFGYKDGKFSADLGASLGIGTSIKLEVDFSGMVNAAEGTAKAAWTMFTDFFNFK